MAAFATFPTLIPVFQHEWSMNNTQAGWISGIFFGGYVIAVAVLTALTDRVDAKRIYLVSMALSSIAALGFALFAEGLWSASAWSLLQGVGLAGTYMPGLRILVDLLPARYQRPGNGLLHVEFRHRGEFLLSDFRRRGGGTGLAMGVWHLRPRARYCFRARDAGITVPSTRRPPPRYPPTGFPPGHRQPARAGIYAGLHGAQCGAVRVPCLAGDISVVCPGAATGRRVRAQLGGG